MIKLERIYLQNYKNIAEADLPLGNINVIVGENGSGKSNLLSVIPFLNYIINGPINDIKEISTNNPVFVEFGTIFNVSEIGKPEINRLNIKIEFYDTLTDIYYMYEVNFDFILKGDKESEGKKFKRVYRTTTISNENFSFKYRSQTGKPITIFKRNLNKIVYGKGVKKSELISDIDEYVSVIRMLNLFGNNDNVTEDYKKAISILDTILHPNIYYLSSHMLKNNLVEVSTNRILSFNLSTEIDLLLKLPQAKEYKGVLKKILNIDDYHVIDLQHIGVIIRVVKNNISRSLEELSDGTLVLLALITKIFSDSSDIFFIEEPENSIHPKALYELMKLIREKSLDKQFIITTHSPYLLNMIKPDEVLVAEIQEDGLSKITKLPDVKAIKKKLAKSFMSFGDIVFGGPENEDDSE